MSGIRSGPENHQELACEHPGNAGVVVDGPNQRAAVPRLPMAAFNHALAIGKSRWPLDHRTIGNRVDIALRVPSLAEHPFASVERGGSLQNQAHQARARELDEYQGRSFRE